MTNKVELIGYYGNDEIIACSAWTSTNRELTEEKKERIPKLINKLWSEGHETPFEKGIVHFLVDTDIASHIHLLKHRIASINAECLEKSTLISFENINGGISQKISVEDLYHKFHSGRKHQNTRKDLEYSKRRIKNMKIRVLNEKTGIFESSNIKDIWKTGLKKIYKIKLRNEKELMCSDNHPVYTKEGYKSVNTGLMIGDMVGCNGVSINIESKPWTFKDFFSNSEFYTRKEFAIINNISYELCKKWGYIFDAKFKTDENKNFKKGCTPWNKGSKGYSINIKNRNHNPLKGDKSHFWKGGISTDRAKIGQWTRQNAKKVHEKYNYTCQNCESSHSKLVAHHIIPVCQDESKAYEFDNLITVCKNCHKKIHKSLQSEKEFADKVLNVNFSSFQYDKRLNKKVNNLKQVHFSDIISIEYIKDEYCYDLEIEGKWKNFVANGIVTHNSARYKELKEDKFYLPEDWKELIVNDEKVAKFTPFQKISNWYEYLQKYTELCNNLYHQCLEDLTPLLGRKRAKESARFFKTYNSQIQSDIMFNMRSFYNFLKLRNSEHSQKEIQTIANTMLYLIENISDNPFKHTLESWNMTSDKNNLLL